MQFFIIDVWQEESIWTWEGWAADESAAEEAARLQLNEDWEQSYETWDDLAEDMDGTALRWDDQRLVRDAAPALLKALQSASDWLTAIIDPAQLGDDDRALLASYAEAIALATTPPTVGDGDPWSCDRCGNTDQDGSDICVDCGEEA